MRVTKKMKRIGSKVVFEALGPQFSPDWLNEEELAEAIFLAMLKAAPHNAKIRVCGETSPVEYRNQGQTPAVEIARGNG